MVSSPCLCIVGDVTTARQILQDTSSTKPYAMYRLFDQMSSGVSFFTSEGTRYHHVRKSASVAFNTRVIQTTIETVVKEKLSEWINHTLPTMQDSVDIVTEMQLLSVRIIAQAQFEYDLQSDEAIEIKSHLQSQRSAGRSIVVPRRTDRVFGNE
jgi:cytochrome P450